MIKNIINLINEQITKFYNFINIIYELFHEYIEVIIILIINIATIFNIHLININYKNKFINNLKIKMKNINENKKEIKKYVKLYKWDKINVDNFTNKIIHKPLNWRPTVIDKILFKNEISLIIKDIKRKYNKIIKNYLKNNKNVFHNTFIINKMNNFYKFIKNKFNEYYSKIIKNNIRNINMSTAQFNKMINIPKKFKNLKLLQADKHYGNVMIYNSNWIKMKQIFLNANNNNFVKINLNKNNIINDAIKSIINLVFKFKNIISDYIKTIRILKSNRLNSIGIFQAIPKVHKKDKQGNPIKKIRPIINLKDTIISISSGIIKEIARKINYGLKLYCQHKIEMDDIRDIILSVNEFNLNNNNNYNINNMISADINSMYDVINKNDVFNSFNYAISNLLPYDFINIDMIDLFFKAANHMFNNAYFEHEKEIYYIYNSQIQGSKSGSDCCSLVLNVDEIKNENLIQQLTLFHIRYKDDLIIIPKNKINVNEVESKILSKLYSKYEFEYDINVNKAEICDIEIYTNDQKTLETRTLEDKKIRSFINKSSNVKQCINGVLKTLQERYIVINSNYKNYKKTKKKIYNIFIETNEWTPYDIRHTQHIKFSKRIDFLNKYQQRKKIKENKYINSNQITLNNNKWWDNNNDKKSQINTYLTYQKTLCDEKAINSIIKNAEKYIPPDIKNISKLNLYFKYQPPLKAYL